MKLNEPAEMEDISEPSAIASSMNRWNENALGTNPAVGSPPASEREIHGPDGEVIKICGADWLDAVNFSDPDESVLILAATREWVHQIKCDLANAFPGVHFVDLEKGDRSAKKRIGTIRDAKDTEADTAILFVGVPYSAYRVITDPAVRNDVLCMFYVGTTRSTKLVEVYDYLRYRDGTRAPAPLDVIA